MTQDTPKTDQPEPEPMPTIRTTDHGSLEARKAFNAAFAKAQGAYQPIVKNRSVSIKPRETAAYSFKYADLQEIQSKTRPALSANGLSTTSQMIPDEKGVHLAMVLMHAEGFERTSEVFVTYGEEIKQFGGRLKFMRRYMVQGLLDVDADDDLDENGDDTGTSEGSGNTASAPKATAPRGPARKSASSGNSSAPPPADEPPIDEAELAARASTRTANAAAARQTVTPTSKDEGSTFHAEAGAIHKDGKKVEPADNPAAGAEPEHQQIEGDTGELAEQGEINFLLKRAKNRNADMAVVLAKLKLSFLDPATLKNLTKAQWALIKAEV